MSEPPGLRPHTLVGSSATAVDVALTASAIVCSVCLGRLHLRHHRCAHVRRRLRRRRRRGRRRLRRGRGSAAPAWASAAPTPPPWPPPPPAAVACMRRQLRGHRGRDIGRGRRRGRRRRGRSGRRRRRCGRGRRRGQHGEAQVEAVHEGRPARESLDDLRRLHVEVLEVEGDRLEQVLRRPGHLEELRTCPPRVNTGSVSWSLMRATICRPSAAGCPATVTLPE